MCLLIRIVISGERCGSWTSRLYLHMKRIQLIEITAIAVRRMSILEYVDLRPQQQEKQLILMEFTEDNIT